MSEPTSATVVALLRAAPPERALGWAASQFGPGARILSAEPLRGGQSHANHVLEVDTGEGGRIEAVLRRWVRPGWQETDPAFSAKQESATFALLARSGVPAPRLLAADPSGDECDVPAILTTRAAGLPPAGLTDPAGFVWGLAQALLSVHAVDPEAAARTVPAYSPYYRRDELAVPAWTRRPALWERAIETAAGEPPAGRLCFIHRDYHPGNTLWLAGRLSAIVDWTTASFGPPAVDLSHMRANLAMTFGLDLADAFLIAHELASGSRNWHPYWDLRVAVDFLPDLPAQAAQDPRLRRLEAFVEHAMAAIR